MFILITIGDGTQLTPAMANFNLLHTTEVGACSDYANNYGLYDMHGNVAEWCLDRRSSYASSPVTDPVGTEGSGDCQDFKRTSLCSMQRSRRIERNMEFQEINPKPETVKVRCL
ncbi:MAG: formylglycine-generating enzyme family protein [Bacteroidales bacterium]|nr:formylglycine-generating enzyme family protein [Bacteroidales bacterium]